MRLSPVNGESKGSIATVDETIAKRRRETDEFYASVHPAKASEAEKGSAASGFLPGMLWSKQNYLFDVERWLEGDDPSNPPPQARKTAAIVTGGI